MRILLLAGILSAGARAQSLAEPPPIVQLVRKPGIGAVSTRPYANARAKDGTRITAETEISREHLWFLIEPRISYVFEDFAQADPEFWKGKAK